LRKPHHWTEDEDLIIRREYRHDRASADRLAARFGVDYNSMHHRIRRLGITRSNRRVRWTAKMDDKLALLLPKHPIAKVARMLGLGIGPVARRAYLQGISRRNREGWYTKKDVCQVCGVDHLLVQAWIDSGSLKASWHNGERPSGSGGQAKWHIEASDLRDFIRRCPDDLQGRMVDMVQLVEVLAGIKGPMRPD